MLKLQARETSFTERGAATSEKVTSTEVYRYRGLPDRAFEHDLIVVGREHMDYGHDCSKFQLQW